MLCVEGCEGGVGVVSWLRGAGRRERRGGLSQIGRAEGTDAGYVAVLLIMICFAAPSEN